MPTLTRRSLRLSTLGLAAAALLALAACGRDDNRTAGEKLDSAVAKTEQGAAEAKADIKQGATDLSADAKAAAAKAGHAMDNAADKLGDKVSDAGITASINAELAKDPTLSALRINVDTSGGRVVLSGTAPSSLAKDRATSLAQAVKGVSSVDNRLEVRG